jgi:hypothetical protein
MANSSFLKKRLSSLGDNLIFLLLLSSYGGGGVISFFTTRSAYAQGLPFYKAIIWGLGAFLLVALLANVLHYLYIRQRRQTAAGAGCLDTWLHEIALSHRQNISRYVHVEKCWIQRHELLRDKPYLDFAIVVRNQSVYDVSINSLAGQLDFGPNLLAKPVELASNPVHDRPLGSIDTVTVRQPLEKEEVIYILNGRTDRFNFGALEVAVGGGSKFPEVKSENLNLQDISTGNEDLLDAYPKIPIDIRSAKSEMIADLDSWEMREFDGLMTMELYLKINRSIPAKITSAHLSANVRGEVRTLRASSGDIWEGEVIRKGGERVYKGKKLTNLIQPIPLVIDESGVTAFVQFRLEKWGGRVHEKIEFALTLKDESGEEHWAEGEIPAQG